MAGLSKTGDRGNEPKYGPELGQYILALLDKPPPARYSNWIAPLLARERVDIHEQHIWRFLRAQKIDLSGRKSWCQSTDPDFVPKVVDIVIYAWLLRPMPWCFRSAKKHRSGCWSEFRNTSSYQLAGR
jgi:hypothetical protein